ncbi:hypothetical protein ABZ348_17185 [Streptomyces sp. NPDC005963]|uniref:hypothetical protein n=1 Tax=Streptomyces sp. NPDC005963 TaxID=3156721 RepID=UPI003405BD65
MSDTLAVGDIAVDTRTGDLGVVMDTGVDPRDGRYSLRPLGGGVEWTADPGDVRPATNADRLRPALSEVNARSRKGGAAWG